MHFLLIQSFSISPFLGHPLIIHQFITSLSQQGISTKPTCFLQLPNASNFPTTPGKEANWNIFTYAHICIYIQYKRFTIHTMHSRMYTATVTQFSTSKTGEREAVTATDWPRRSCLESRDLMVLGTVFFAEWLGLRVGVLHPWLGGRSIVVSALCIHHPTLARLERYF